MRNWIVFVLFVSVAAGGCAMEGAGSEYELITAEDLADGQRPVIDLGEHVRTVVDGTTAPIDLSRIDVLNGDGLVPLSEWLIDELGYSSGQVAALGSERFVVWPGGELEEGEGVGGQSQALTPGLFFRCSTGATPSAPGCPTYPQKSTGGTGDGGD